MKRLPLIMCCLAFAFVTLQASADIQPIDPTIGLGDPNCSSFHGDSLSTIGPSGSFTFTANSSGGGYFGFCNGSGAILTTVDIKFLDPLRLFQDTSLIICNSTVFTTCTKTWTAGVFDLFFSGTQTESNGDSGGIPTNQLMIINLNDPSPSSTSSTNGPTTDTPTTPETQCIPSSTVTCSGGWTAGTQFFGQGNGLVTIPEPASLVLLSSGLLALWSFRRRK